MTYVTLTRQDEVWKEVYKNDSLEKTKEFIRNNVCKIVFVEKGKGWFITDKKENYLSDYKVYVYKE